MCPFTCELSPFRSLANAHNTVGAEIITILIPQTIVCVMEVIAQINLIPQEVFIV